MIEFGLPKHHNYFSPILAVILLVEDALEGSKLKVKDCVKLMEFEELEMCLGSVGHSQEDILISTNGQINWTAKLASYGPEHIIKLAPEQIKSSVIKGDKFKLSLNNSLGYHIAFVDSHFHVTNINPAATPLTFVRIGSDTETWIYLKVDIL